MANQWQKLAIPFAAGLAQKFNPFAMPPQALDIAKNVEMRELGGLQTRYPFSNIGSNILGGGTISDTRRIVTYEDELLLFTKETLYSWSARDSAWVSKGTYLAPKITERQVFINTAEQITADRAELSNVVVYAWVQSIGSSSGVYCAAVDKTTGAVLVAPTQVTGGSNATRPRLIALTNKILLFWVKDAGLAPDLVAIAIDPASLSASITAAATTVYAIGGFNTHYDVVGLSTTAYVAARATIGGVPRYSLLSVTEALAVAKTDKGSLPCDGPIAVSLAPNNTHLQVVRANGTNIVGDYISIAGPFTSVTTGQAVGTGSGTINQIAAAHRSVQDSGQYRCYAFWSSTESSDETSFDCKSNWVDTGGTLGTQAVLVKRLGVASRAFDRNGKVFVWLAFAGESGTAGMGEPLGFRAALQNTYFLYKDDGSLIAKAAMHRAGGFSQAQGHLPNVQSLGSETYAFCGIERRVIPLGSKHKGYSDRGPRDIKVTFDSNEARRCARLGRTLYITGGQILQYDGVGLTEVGFHLFPWFFASVSGGAGNVAAGTYNVKGTTRWENAKGERDRSTTATGEQITLGASNKITVQMIPLHVTLKTGTRQAVAAEYWRTTDAPTADAPYYLGTSQDPADTSNPNRYLANDPTASFLSTFDDDLADADMAKNEPNPENGGYLENLAPPAATIIAATQDRIFLAGISDAPYQVWYSKLRGDGEVAAFHDNLVFEVPPSGGPITALAFLNETLIVFCERNVWMLPGEGFANDSSDQNYGPARVISLDVGAKSAEVVALGPGGLWFQSNKGWYLLPGGGAPVYVGANISDYDTDSFQAIHVMESKHQVRLLSTSRMLVFDWVAQQWFEWTVSDGLHAAIWSGTYHYLATAAVKAEQTTYTAADYEVDVETSWQWPAGPFGNVFARRVQILATYQSAHQIRFRIARLKGNAVTTYDFDKWWTAGPAVVGGPMRPKIRLNKPKGTAYKFRITTQTGGDAHTAPTGECLKLTGLVLEWADRGGVDRRADSALEA